MWKEELIKTAYFIILFTFYHIFCAMFCYVFFFLLKKKISFLDNIVANGTIHKEIIIKFIFFGNFFQLIKDTLEALFVQVTIKLPVISAYNRR